VSGDEKKSVDPSHAYAPPEQAIIPGYKNYISFPKKDWRKWEDGRGNKVDAPAYRGQQFTGKVIPPLTDNHGNPIREETFQIVRDAKGTYRIIDWSLPADKNFAADEEDDGRTPPLMGRCVYETKHSLDRAKLAMSILARKKRDKDAGLPSDPVQCKDLADKPIFMGKLVLVRYARGRFAECYAIIDTACDIAAPGYRLVCKKDVTLKRAVELLVAESKKTRKSAPVARKVFIAAGAPMTFSAPEGFGGFGGFQDRESPTPDSKSWDVTVDLFARTGKWCKTARLIWADQFPAELVEQCENYREEYLEDPRKFYDDPAETTNDDYRERVESHEPVRDILECFEGSLVIDHAEEA
jgi:hypothetical protein